MTRMLMRRLEALERKLDTPAKQAFVAIHEWGHDSEEVRESKLARWRAGEDIEGAPSDIEDRDNAQVWMVVFVERGEVLD